jgi:hypothetical protein
MYRVRLANRLRRRLRNPQVTYLAGLDQLGHGSPGLIYGSIRIDPMLVVEVDVIYPETLQGIVAGLSYVLGPPVDTQPCTILRTLVAELGGEHDLIPPLRYRLAD